MVIFEANGLSLDTFIYNVNLEEPRQNEIRRQILQHLRGFGANGFLFTGFPSNVQWEFVEIEPSDYAS
jgi:hypothetical protein